MALRANAIVFALTAVLATGCPPVDDPVDTDTTEPIFIDAAIVGSWTSTGDDVSPLLAAFSITTVDATFNDDGSYEVTSTDSAGTSTDFAGTYTVDDSTSPATIDLVQTAPFSATVTGIWEVAGGVLTYEVVQDGQGFNAPTPESGFGSTSGPNVNPGDNVQIYR